MATIVESLTSPTSNSITTAHVQRGRKDSLAKIKAFAESTEKKKASDYGIWGRKTGASLDTSIGAYLLIFGCPIWITLNYIALEHSQGSLFKAIETVWSEVNNGNLEGLLSLLPQPSWKGTLLYAGWTLFQALLFIVLPGRTSYGQKTPGGNLLSYNTNGLEAVIITHLLFFIAVHQEWISASIIARNWQGLFVAGNVWGYLLAIFARVKAEYFPTHPEDCKKSGSWAHDFWMGVEMNPRIGSSFDLKLFMNGRPGLAAWTLIDISFAAYQYELHGYVSNSILIVLVLHALYALDFFANEDWYLRTIDIAHDHFGMMLAWGDAVFLPTFYTLQAQYSARYPCILSSTQVCLILGLGMAGYIVFRSANEQKDHIRKMDGNTTVWGRPAEVIRCTYQTTDGKQHNSILITCGWWGVSRHANYTADLAMCFAMCASCGTFTTLLPWSYFLFMCVMLTHRAWRDEGRCKAKYGEKWDEYCKLVPWRLIPGVF